MDYPDIAVAVCRRVVSGDCERGILLDGAGIGSCIAANKIKGIRAALCYDIRTVINSREHNNANVLTLGGPLHDAGQLCDMAKTWLQTRFGGGRHMVRVNKIMAIERRRRRAETDGPEPADREDRGRGGRAHGLAAGAKAGRSGASGGSRAPCPEHPASPPCRRWRRTWRSYIDHTMLRPEAPTAAFDKLCQEALQYHFFSVCVNSCRVAYVARKLQGSGVKVCSVVGFPLGAMTSRSKAFETREAIEDGASEIDMVINVGLLKSGDYHGVEEDIRGGAPGHAREHAC